MADEMSFNEFDELMDEEDAPVMKKGLKKPKKVKKPPVPAIPPHYGRVTEEMFKGMKARGYHCLPKQMGIHELFDEYALTPMIYKKRMRYPVIFVKQSAPFVWIPLETAEEVTEAFEKFANVNWYGISGDYFSRRTFLYKADWASIRPLKEVSNAPERIYYDATLKMVIETKRIRFKPANDGSGRFDAFINAASYKNVKVTYWTEYLSALEKGSDGDTEDKLRAIYVGGLSADSVITSQYEAEDLTTGYTAAHGKDDNVDIFISTGPIKSPKDFFNKIMPYDPDAYLKDCIEAMVESDTKSIAIKTRDMRELQERATTLARDISRIRLTSDLIKQNGSAHIRGMIEKMAKLPNIERVEYRKKSVCFITNVIWTERVKVYGKDIPAKYVGKFDIEVDFFGRTVRIRNSEMDVRVKTATVASTANDRTCLGSYRGILNEAMAMADYEILLTTLMDFLCDTHTDDSTARSNLIDKFLAVKPVKTCSSLWLNIVEDR